MQYVLTIWSLRFSFGAISFRLRRIWNGARTVNSFCSTIDHAIKRVLMQLDCHKQKFNSICITWTKTTMGYVILSYGYNLMIFLIKSWVLLTTQGPRLRRGGIGRLVLIVNVEWSIIYSPEKAISLQCNWIIKLYLSALSRIVAPL